MREQFADIEDSQPSQHLQQQQVRAVHSLHLVPRARQPTRCHPLPPSPCMCGFGDLESPRNRLRARRARAASLLARSEKFLETTSVRGPETAKPCLSVATTRCCCPSCTKATGGHPQEGVPHKHRPHHAVFIVQRRCAPVFVPSSSSPSVHPSRVLSSPGARGPHHHRRKTTRALPPPLQKNFRGS